MLRGQSRIALLPDGISLCKHYDPEEGVVSWIFQSAHEVLDLRTQWMCISVVFSMTGLKGISLSSLLATEEPRFP